MIHLVNSFALHPLSLGSSYPTSVGYFSWLTHWYQRNGYQEWILCSPVDCLVWWSMILLPALGTQSLSLILAPPWSGQLGDNTGYCGLYTVHKFPCHHKQFGVIVTYSTHFILMIWLICLPYDDTPVHLIDVLNHEQTRKNTVNLLCGVTSQLQPAPTYQYDIGLMWPSG